MTAKERFAFATDNAVEELRDSTVPANTKKHTLWSENVYKKWAEARSKEFLDFVPENPEFPSVTSSLKGITIEEMNYWLSKFVLEARKTDGGDYRHEVLYSILCGLNRIIKEEHPTISLFHSPQLKPLQKALDGRLKHLQATQQPFTKQAEALSSSDEEELWSKGVLGTHSPKSVINALMFLTGKIFVLRGGKEQRDLTHDQFTFEEQDDGSMIVTYKEKVSKTNQGGLKRRKIQRKEVKHIEQPTNERSFTFMYNFYQRKCPDDVPIPAFYLRPKDKWKYSNEIWFDKSPIGHNTLDKMFKTMCKDGGLDGNYSNHSCRATGVTRMYDAGVPEKVIMQRSGHRSLEGVRTYRRENQGDALNVSNALNNTMVKEAEKSPSSSQNEDDLLLVSSCEEYEKKTEKLSTEVDMGGLFEGGTFNNVKITINVNK